MRVLLLSQIVVYPADAGPKVKTLQVLRHLATRHEVVYCAFARSEKETQDAQKLNEICRSVKTVPIKRSKVQDVRFLVESLLTGDSFLLRRDESNAMHTLVRQQLQEQQIDVLHVDQLNMMRFVPSDWRGTVILDEHNAVWQVVDRLRMGTPNPLARWLLGREVRLVGQLEGEACRRAQFVLAVSQHDAQALHKVAGESTPVEIVPITVDAGHFNEIVEARDPQPHRLFTIGTMFWPPNSEGVMWWLHEGYEYLRAIHPNVTYEIVGAHPPHRLQAEAERHDGVRLHGYVADTTPFWTQAAVLAVPILSGGGVRVKILEAMAMGVPIVSTSIGCEGLDVRDGEHLLVADTPESFAHACAKILEDRNLAKRIVQNARRLVLERYDTRIALQPLDLIYEQLQRESLSETSSLRK